MATVYDSDPELKGLLGYFQSLADARPTFDSFMNLTDESPDLDTGCLTFEMRDDFVGNLVYRTLHGGLISAVLDTVGGAVVFLSVYQRVKGKPRDAQIKAISKNATIDLRVDYLRPGRGKRFRAWGWILRSGKRFAVTRMELRNDQDELIAVGTGCYSIAVG